MTRNEIIQQSKTDQESGGMFMVIPSVVMLDQELSLSAKMLYGVITWKCGERAYCWLTNRALGEILGLSSKRVSALLSDLERRGHVETEIQKDDETGQILRRYIYPVVKSSRGLVSPIPENEDTPPLAKEDTSPQKEGEPIPKNEAEKNKEEKIKNNIPPKAPRGGRRTHKYDLAEDAVPILQAYVGEDRELHRALGAFIQQRVELRAINSARAVKMLLGELDRLSEGRREDKLLLIQQSMANSWKSVFPLRKDGGGAAAGEPSAPSLVAREEVPTW